MNINENSIFLGSNKVNNQLSEQNKKILKKTKNIKSIKFYI